MNFSKFLLVEWLNENVKTYSCVSRNTVIDGDIRALLDEEIRGREVRILWKRKAYAAKIHECGTEIDMQHEVDTFASEAARMDNEIQSTHGLENTPAVGVIPAKKNKATSDPAQKTSKKRKESRSQLLAEVLDQVDDNDIDPQETVEKLKIDLQSKDDLLKTYKDKIENMRREIERLKSVSALPSDDMVDIGGNVYVRKGEIDTLKTLSDTLTVFARNLFRIVFNTDEVVGHSLFGRACNANKGSKPVLPAVDATKRDAVIMYSLKTYGIEESGLGRSKNKVPFLSDVKRSLSDFVREINAKCNK